MVQSPAGREYRLLNLVVADSEAQRFWICQDCGAVIGPLRRYQEAHDAWHARAGA